jgi:Hg(II)-responsive transcriptional regulator
VNPLTIGELGARAQVNIETLRYYERRGLLPAPPRSVGNYRLYPPEAVRVVRFIKRAQELGFTLKEIEELLSLKSAPGAQCADVQKLAEEKIKNISAKIRTLQAIKEALAGLLTECPGQAPVHECPILEAIDEEP